MSLKFGALVLAIHSGRISRSSILTYHSILFNAKQIVPQYIVQLELGAYPFHLKTILRFKIYLYKEGEMETSQSVMYTPIWFILVESMTLLFFEALSSWSWWYFGKSTTPQLISLDSSPTSSFP